MNKEKIYSRAVAAGYIVGLAVGFLIMGVIASINDDKERGLKIIGLGAVVFFVGILMAPSKADINYLKA